MEPTNLQIIKTEQTTTTTENYTNNIKERLNLHVKRRLLQEAQQTPTKMPFADAATAAGGGVGGGVLSTTTTIPITTNSKSPANTNSDNGSSRLNQKQQMKDTPKTRRPYQRRTDKINTKSATNLAAATTTTTTTAIPTSTPQITTIITNTTTLSPQTESPGTVRKKRQKTKHQQNIVTNPVTTTTTTATPTSLVHETSLNAITNEDDGSHDGMHELEARTANARDKKCPDILNMVLSMKRRALLQDPEINEFLHKIVGAIKS